MVCYKEYVAGWLDSSIRAVFSILPTDADSIKYALITCLDSNLNPRSLWKKGSALRSLIAEARPIGKGLILPTGLLWQAESSNQLFFGFDEVCFFPTEKVQPRPHAAWLVGPARIDQQKLDKVAIWMSENSCTLALGDGEGLNFVVKARGLVRHLLGHSLDQAHPNATFVASPARSVAG